MLFAAGEKQRSFATAVILCLLAWIVYLTIFGFGAASDGDTESYRHFLVVRSLGYPIVLWFVDRGGMLPVFGAFQLAMMFAGFLILWRVTYTRLSPVWAWVVLVLCLANVEIAKYAFRQAPEALFISAVAWHVSAMLERLKSSDGSVWALLFSAATIILIRPAGLPLLIATALVLAAYSTPRAMIRFILGALTIGWLFPSAANGITRGFYAPQIYGGFHAIVPITHTIMVSPANESLPPPLSDWAARMAQLKEVYDRPSWPFEQGLLQALASTYATQALTPEFGSVGEQSFEGLRAANERGREGLAAALKVHPWAYVEAVSANAIDLIAAPGFIDPVIKGTIAGRLDSPTVTEPLLRSSLSEALNAQRVIPHWMLFLLRAIGVAIVMLALAAGMKLAFDVLTRIATHRKENRYLVGVACALGTMILGYILIVGMVSAIPRFTLAIYPVLVMFLVTMLALIGSRFRVVVRQRPIE